MHEILVTSDTALGKHYVSDLTWDLRGIESWAVILSLLITLFSLIIIIIIIIIMVLEIEQFNTNFEVPVLRLLLNKLCSL